MPDTYAVVCVAVFGALVVLAGVCICAAHIPVLRELTDAAPLTGEQQEADR